MKSPRFEVARTHAGWHARFRAANGRAVFWTETYRRRRAAEHAIDLITSGEAESLFGPVRVVDER